MRALIVQPAEIQARLRCGVEQALSAPERIPLIGGAPRKIERVEWTA
ncbi:MAG TPA: hypothetical protein VM513_14120 [Kofleriaceae bacterium]|nr:hypothetical protein [Kofleriaceae bacterium]